MPCNSDYLESTSEEKAMTKVAQLLDELDGKPFDPERFGDGYHKAVYNRRLDKNKRDALVHELCSRLQGVDVSQYSLEMQIWWRDHQRADKKRLEFELARAKEASERAAAIAKLTAYERKLLGIKK